MDKPSQVDKIQNARRAQHERIERLKKEKDRLAGLIAAGTFDDDPMALARARANLKSASWTIKSYIAQKQFRGNPKGKKS